MTDLTSSKAKYVLLRDGVGPGIVQAYVPAPLRRVGRNLKSRWNDLYNRLDSAEAYLGSLRSRHPLDLPYAPPLTYLSSAAQFMGEYKWSPNSFSVVNAKAVESISSRPRTGNSWVGADCIGNAWYVAPPAPYLPGLLTDLAKFLNDQALPRMLRGCIGMLQLLLIHPFLDGNGRTARLVFLARGASNFGSTPALIRALRRMWESQGLGVHRCSMALRERDNWDEWLGFCADIIRDELSLKDVSEEQTSLCCRTEGDEK